MTDTNIESVAALGLLRELRGAAGIPVRPESLPRFGGVAPFLLDGLVERGLVYRKYGGLVTTSGAANRLLDAIDAEGAKMLEEFQACEYTLSHTGAWCGNPYC